MYVTVCNRSVSYHRYEQSCKYIYYSIYIRVCVCVYFATKRAREKITPDFLGICLTEVSSIASSAI